MISPFIVDEGRRKGMLAVGAFALGAIASSTAVGIVLGIAGMLLPASATWLLLVVGVAAVALAIADLKGKTPTTRRQTRKMWWRKGPWAASLIWGADLGVGFTTIKVASLYWAAALAVLAEGSSQIALLMGAFGVGLAANVAVGVAALPRGEARDYHPLQATSLLRIARPFSGAVLLLWGVSMVVVGVVG